jgi:RND family efflux transporter MFP subunit
VVEGVEVLAIEPAEIDEVYETTGNIRSERESLVAGRVMGVITSVLVREGDMVKAGQLLVTIDDRDAARRLHAAQMTLESAKQNMLLQEATWLRYKNLFEEKALSRQEMDQVETQKNVARAEYERAEAMADEARIHHSFTQVKAPVAGRVTQKHIDAGSMATPGMPLLLIEETGSFYVEASVDERLREKIRPGMAAELVVDRPALSQQTTVRRVLTSIDPLSRTFIVKINPANLPVSSGLFVRVRIPVGKKEAIVVPAASIVEKGQLTGVYAVDNEGIITYRLVRTGATYAGNTEILSGLTTGERVIVKGVRRALDGGVLAGGKVR